ncbi:MAG: hypothetical protein KME52_19305 [Desmonostoc geniculatum HA4340-LM1]|jgi:hypothetical protein|nr:hypothetical protein [Desmonostoc geniculatum HA4340-LM1]
MPILCSKCQSDNIRKLSLIYQENVIHTTSTIRGSIGSKSTAAYKDETSTTSIGKTASPPQKPEFIPIIIVKAIAIEWVIFMILSSIFQASFLAGLSLLIGLPLYLFWTLQKNIKYSRIYPKLYQKWENSFMCQRCGTIFEIIEN